MKRIALVFGADVFALALADCGSLAGRDYGACYEGVGFSSSAAYTWEESR